MTESTESTEPTGGFDRRSLIKKGLVVGGAAVALPVITTFDAPAFAASGPTTPPTPTARAHFSILLGVNALDLAKVLVVSTPVTPTDGTNPCGLSGWAGLNNGNGDVNAPSGLLTIGAGGSLVFTSPSCVFVEGAHGDSGCSPGVITNGGHTITFGLATVSLNLSDDVYLTLACPPAP
jgi:hypothetical protein